MSSKLHSKVCNNFHRDSKRTDHLERVRIIQDKLVFVSGLPAELGDSKLLKSVDYFGRYGQVAKVILNRPMGFRKNGVIQVYVTYDSEVSASLAIVALDGFDWNGRTLKVSYGTTKYCNYFLKGSECLNQDCFYLHKIEKNREVLNGDHSSTFQQQNDRAFDVVHDNLEEVIEKLIEEGDQKPDEGFPSLSETVDFLVGIQFITRSEVDAFIRKLKHISIPKLQPTHSNPSEERLLDSPKEGKIVKSSSLSTMGSPAKSEMEQKSHQQPSRTESPLKPGNSASQIPQKSQIEMIRKESLEEKIEKMLIRKILRAKSPKSRLNFASSQKQPQEHNKLKGIIQKYFIAAI